MDNYQKDYLLNKCGKAHEILVKSGQASFSCDPTKIWLYIRDRDATEEDLATTKRNRTALYAWERDLRKSLTLLKDSIVFNNLTSEDALSFIAEFTKMEFVGETLNREGESNG